MLDHWRHASSAIPNVALRDLLSAHHASGAAVTVVVRADIDGIQPEHSLEQCVQVVHGLTSESPAGDLWLVGDHHHRHPCIAELLAYVGRPLLQAQLGLTAR